MCVVYVCCVCVLCMCVVYVCRVCVSCMCYQLTVHILPWTMSRRLNHTELQCILCSHRTRAIDLCTKPVNSYRLLSDMMMCFVEILWYCCKFCVGRIDERIYHSAWLMTPQLRFWVWYFWCFIHYVLCCVAMKKWNKCPWGNGYVHGYDSWIMNRNKALYASPSKIHNFTVVCKSMEKLFGI